MQVCDSETSGRKAVPDLKADEYLQERVSAEEVQHRYVIPVLSSGLCFACKCSGSVFVLTPWIAQGVPLQAQLSQLVIRHYFACHHTESAQ